MCKFDKKVTKVGYLLGFILCLCILNFLFIRIPRQITTTKTEIEQLNNYIFEINSQIEELDKKITEEEDAKKYIKKELEEKNEKILLLEQDLIFSEQELQQVNQDLNDVHSLLEHEVDFDKLCYVVQGECGSSGYEHKLLVANVILNRVNNQRFPDTIEAVLSAKGQFVGYKSFGYNYRFIEYDTVLAVSDALKGIGKKESYGALYFYAPKYVTNTNTISWFNSKTFIFEKHGHRFYK